ncbi:hypothetical protein PT974_05113 [Cladobotryum mycophilum]|uniref:Uncharacterized protein n=1 Tax=Cladobotryum mycophilum TaxID=491253 RepID=A0ABR0SR29_9HYPO
MSSRYGSHHAQSSTTGLTQFQMYSKPSTESERYESQYERYKTAAAMNQEEINARRPLYEELPLDEMSNTGKPQFAPHVHSVPSELIQNPIGKWRPHAVRSLPWAGIGSLILALLTAVAMAVVLVAADGEATETWPTKRYPVPLAVVLAVLVAFANATLLHAHSEGVTISWWIRMLRGGDLRDTHRYWDHGSSAWKSFVELRYVNKVSLSTLVLVLLLIDGPLLQRAGTSIPVPASTLEMFRVALSTDMLNQPTAYYLSHAPEVNTMSSNFSQIVQDFANNNPIRLDLRGCNGACTATVVGAGFDVKCQSTKVPYNLNGTQTGSSTTVGAINVTTTLTFDSNTITLATLYKPSAVAVGDLVQNVCTLHIAQVKYPIQFINGTASLQPSNTATNNNTISLRYLNREVAGLGRYPSQLGGIYMGIRNMYESSVQLYAAGIFAIQGSGPMRYTYMTSNDDAVGSTRMTWTDPMPYVLDAVRELTFRTAIAFSNDTFYQPVQGIQQRTVNRYDLRGAYLGGALAIIALGAFSVAWLFNEYWLLGRRVSMSPVEIAKAFQAPMTAGASSNAGVDVILRQVGGREVKYGVVHQKFGEAASPSQTLALTSPGQVSWPLKGQYYA